MNSSELSLAKRILADLNSIFKRDPDIIEFTIIPGDDTTNRSPFVLQDHRLALLSWPVKHVYRQVYDQFLATRATFPVRPGTPIASSISSASNGALASSSSSTSLAEDLPLWDAIHQWTRLLLLINPELALAWSARKELLSDERLDPLAELQFSELLLTHKAKTSHIFSHRQWILKRFYPRVPCASEIDRVSQSSTNCSPGHSATVQDTSNDADLAEQRKMIVNELRVSLDAASRYGRNYYAWSHRSWLIRHYCIGLDFELIHTDLVVTRNWLESHVSDYSVYHYRQFLIHFLMNQFYSLDDNSNTTKLIQHGSNMMLDSNSNPHSLKKLLTSEMDLIKSLLGLYRDQEALFLHRRFLILLRLKLWPKNSEEIRQEELDFIDEHFSLSIRQTSHNEWQLALMKRHIRFLEKVLMWNLES